jgi:NADH-quinone oxidoreductase subunit E
LGIEPGQTTPDRQFSLNAVNCLGVCAIGPVMVLDGKFFGEMSPMKARRILGKFQKKGNGGKA